MTQEELGEAIGYSARLRFLSKRSGRLSSPEYYERQVAQERLEELGVEPPKEPEDGS
jgi:hypothetical protein